MGKVHLGGCSLRLLCGCGQIAPRARRAGPKQQVAGQPPPSLDGLLGPLCGLSVWPRLGFLTAWRPQEAEMLQEGCGLCKRGLGMNVNFYGGASQMSYGSHFKGSLLVQSLKLTSHQGQRELDPLFCFVLTFYSILEYSRLTTSGVQQRDSAIHIHVSVLPQTPLPCRLPWNIEQSSLCYKVGPCCYPFFKNNFIYF